ncbi:MAG: hypothetical protein EXR73_02605 [Myxococcales bacterium]|nr:hypothetical protein [Myxococcales bacterium]
MSRRAAPPRAPAPESRMTTAALRLFAVAAPGLETVVADEVGALPGASELTTGRGGVEFSGDGQTLIAANLALRVATRVLVRVGAFTARDFARLRREIASLPWERFAKGAPCVEVVATARKSRLYHTGGIAERIAGGVADRLGAPAAPDAAPALRIMARVEDDQFTISVDSSGELLHRRGWRVEARAAPLRETLAAGLLALAGWDGRTPLCDPMCGAGTILIEGANLALGRAPGAGRAFAWESWPCVAGLVRPAPTLAVAVTLSSAARPTLLGSDRDANAIETCRRNALRADVADVVTLAVADAADAPLPDTPGLIVLNPPYGQRLDAAGLAASLRALGRRGRAHRIAVLSADPQLPRALGRRPSREHALENGGLPVRLFLFAPGE